MALPQYPLDGVPGKAWKVTSQFGWRIHPVKKTRKHHNGDDFIGLGKGPFYIESAFDGKVAYAGPSKTKLSNGEPGGFGWYVKVTSKIDGKWYSLLYAHLEKGSIKVKTGQKIEAGTVLGKMGTSGTSTGIHCHVEVWVGKSHGWSDDGKGFLPPLEFIKAQVKKAKLLATKNDATPDDVEADLPEEKPVAPKAAPKAHAAPAAPAPAAPAKKKVQQPMYTVKAGDSYWSVGEKFHQKYGSEHEFEKYVRLLQLWNGNKGLNPGDKIPVTKPVK